MGGGRQTVCGRKFFPMDATLNLKPVDMHVHVVGNGTGGTGCWLRVRGWRQPMAAMMLRHIGLPGGALNGDLDRFYIERLLEQVRDSSLGAAVILAQDDVHDDQGRVMEGVGSFHVPNQYVLNLARQHPEFLPAISIHPARPDALEELGRLPSSCSAMFCAVGSPNKSTANADASTTLTGIAVCAQHLFLWGFYPNGSQK